MLIRRGAAFLLVVLACVAARSADPPPAGSASTALAGTLEREIARTLDYRRALERFESDLAARRDEHDRRVEAERERIAETAGSLQVAPPGSQRVVGLYDRIVEQLKDARPQLRSALERLQRAPGVPSYEPEVDATGLDAPSVADLVERLRRVEADNAARRAKLLGDEREQRWNEVEAWGTLVQRFNDLRIDAIEKLPAPARRRILGPTREGVAQLGREIDQLVLSARLYLARWLHRSRELPSTLSDVFTVGSLAWILLQVLVVVGAYVILRRRIPALAATIRRSGRGRAARWRANRLARLVEVPAPWGLFVLLLFALRWALGGAASWPEIELPFRIAVLYGVYRLAIDVVFAATVGIARYYRLSLDDARTTRLLLSVRSLMRVVVAIVAVLMISTRVLGRGYLYHVVTRFAWVLLLGVAIVLLARWRGVIADAYLATSPAGRLADVVRRTRDRWYGVFVSAASFALLAGRALVSIGGDFAMRFDQTRRALAFVFRRRVEKRAERQGYAEVDVADLPDTVVRAFAEDPVSDGALVVERFPGLDALDDMRRRWLEEDAGASFLLTGEKGTGKTSWLGRIQPVDDVSVSHIVLRDRVPSAERLVALLSREVGVEPKKNGDVDGLAEALVSGPKRMVLVDLGQNLFLGKVGGYDTFEAFVSLVETTCTQVFWVCGMSAFAWDRLFAVRPDLMVFRRHEILRSWTEDEIRELIRVRTEAAGVTLVYDDLLADSRRPGRPEQQEAERGYTRLLWDYSDGNPRVALHFWVHSLVPENSGRLRVRLFRAPQPDEIDALGETSRFLLAAIVVHENLTLAEAAAVTRYAPAICRIHLDRLLDKEIVRRARGRYRLATHWHRAVVRSLKRGNLLSA